MRDTASLDHRRIRYPGPGVAALTSTGPGAQPVDLSERDGALWPLSAPGTGSSSSCVPAFRPFEEKTRSEWWRCRLQASATR